MAYKEPSNRAKLAKLKQDILGDGVKESKLQKYIELESGGNEKTGASVYFSDDIYTLLSKTSSLSIRPGSSRESYVDTLTLSANGKAGDYMYSYFYFFKDSTNREYGANIILGDSSINDHTKDGVRNVYIVFIGGRGVTMPVSISQMASGGSGGGPVGVGTCQLDSDFAIVKFTYSVDTTLPEKFVKDSVAIERVA